MNPKNESANFEARCIVISQDWNKPTTDDLR